MAGGAPDGAREAPGVGRTHSFLAGVVVQLGLVPGPPTRPDLCDQFIKYHDAEIIEDRKFSVMVVALRHRAAETASPVRRERYRGLTHIPSRAGAVHQSRRGGCGESRSEFWDYVCQYGED